MTIPIAALIASVIMSLATLAGTLILVGRWVGKSTQEIATLVAITERMNARLTHVESEVSEDMAFRHEAIRRIEAVERAVTAFTDVRDLVLKLSTTAELENRYLREKMEAFERGLSNLQRQNANRMTGKSFAGEIISGT